MKDGREPIKMESYVIIPLTKGQFTKVDVDSYNSIPILRELWHASWNSCTNSYYAQRALNTKKITLGMHRVIVDAGPRECVDHKNFDTLDNRRENLIICTNTENIRKQRRKPHLKKCKYKGVVMKDGMYRARISFNGDRIHIGYFVTAEEAAIAYNEMARNLFGDFAHLNEV